MKRQTNLFVVLLLSFMLLVATLRLAAAGSSMTQDISRPVGKISPSTEAIASADSSFENRSDLILDASTPPSATLELVSHLGGSTWSVAAQGDYVYAGVGSRLIILDRANPDSPVPSGQTGVLTNVVSNTVAVHGNYAYLTMSAQDLYVIDVSNPATPATVGLIETPDEVEEIAFMDNYAYLAAGSAGLRVVDVTDPTAATEVGSLDTLINAHDVAVSGNYAYVVAGALRIVDISNPTAPVAMGTYPSWSTASVAVAGSYAYLASGGFLTILDVSDPMLPVAVGSIGRSGFTSDVAVASNYAYVTYRWLGLYIFDISDPSAPSELSLRETPGAAKGMTIASTHAYIADLGGGLRAIDVSDPTEPQAEQLVMPPGDARGVDLDGGFAYVADGYGGLRIIDVSNLSDPLTVGDLDTPAPALAVAVADNYAYVATYGNSYNNTQYGLLAVDISDPTNPVQTGYLDTLTYTRDVAVAGDYAYVAAGWGLHVIDVSNPAAPLEVALVTFPDPARSVALSGNYAYVAAEGSGLRVIDVSDPTAPIEVGSLDPDYFTIWDVAVSGSYAYALPGHLYVIDVSNPVTPLLLGQHDLLGAAYGIAVTENLAFVGNWQNGLREIDISDPAAPVEVDFFDTPAWALDVDVAGDYTYVANSTAGLYIFTHELVPPQAYFEGTPTSGGAPLMVSFTNLTAGYFNSVLWEFGDGFVSTQESPLHTYVETGSYSVTLTVSGAAGSDTFTRTSYINTYEPVAAAFTAAPLNGTAPLTVSFTNLSSGDYDTCFWDFGDAETSQACEHPTHIYTTHGVYTVTLSLSGPGGSDSVTREAYVHVYAPPVASFSAMPTTGTPPLDVHFTNLSTGDYDTCLWDFGDGSTSQSCQDPAHVYIATGDYTVSLSLSGPGGGDNETRSEYITVQHDIVIQLPVILKP